jgi:hypothetical protein
MAPAGSARSTLVGAEWCAKHTVPKAQRQDRLSDKVKRLEILNRDRQRKAAHMGVLLLRGLGLAKEGGY